MGRFDGFLICSDIDGTFALRKAVPERNLEAVRYFQAEGGIFTLATGRYAGYSDDLPVRVNGPLITENGARIYDPALGRTLWQFPLDGSGPLWEWIDGKNVSYVALRFTDGPVIAESGKVAQTVLDHPAGQELLQIICGGFSSPEQALAFRDCARETFGARYDIRRSWETGVEFISPLGGKGNCLNCLRSILGEKIHTFIAIGDYENDLAMLRTADRAFTPANACEEVLAAGPAVLCPCSAGAVGELIEILDREISEGKT